LTDYTNDNRGTLPVLPVRDVMQSLTYYTDVLGFNKVFDQTLEDGTLVNAQVEMSGCHIMLNLNPDEAGLQGGGVYLWIRIEDKDIDALYRDLQSKGVHIVQPIADQFWGDRSFSIKDNLGYNLAFNKRLA